MRRFLIFFLPALCACSVFSTTLSGDFVWDDTGLIRDNAPQLETLSNLKHFITQSPFEETLYVRPVLWASFFADYQMWGLNPAGYHFTNIVLHACNASLTALLLCTIGISPPTACLAAVLFAVHPVQTEAVAWISGRNDSLMVLFILCALLCARSYRRATGSLRKKALLAACLAAYAAALLTKETAVIFIPLMASLDLLYAVPNRRRAGILYLLAVAVTVGAAWFWRSTWDGASVTVQLDPALPGGLFSSIAGHLLYYGKALLYPLQLTVAPPVPEPFSISAALVAVGLGVIGTAGWRAGNLRVFLSGLAWTVLFLLPVSGIVDTGIPLLEHRLYGPAIGFCLMLTSIVGTSPAPLKHRFITYRTALTALLICMALVYSVVTLQRNAVWKDDLSLWRDTLKKVPDSLYALNNLGLALNKRGHYGEAVSVLEIACRLYPESSALWANLGMALAQEGNYVQAAAAYKHALRLNPGSAQLHSRLGVVEKDRGAWETALGLFDKAIELDPLLPEPYAHSATLYIDRAQHDKARSLLKEGFARCGENSSLHSAAGHLCKAEHNYESALQHFQEALSLNPECIQTLNSTALLLFAMNRYGEAIAYLNRALLLRPAAAELYLNRGIALFNTGALKSALSDYQRALTLNPDYAEAHLNSAVAFLALPGHTDEALKHLKNTLKLLPDHPKKNLIKNTIRDLEKNNDNLRLTE